MSAKSLGAGCGVVPERVAWAAGRNPAGRFRMVTVLFALLASFVPIAPVRAEPDDDDDKDDAPNNVIVQNGFSDDNFDQWIFQSNNNLGPGGARQRLDSLLSLYVEDVGRACKLTPEQKKKLQLAGRGDIKRFYVLYEKVKQKFQVVKNDQQRMQEIWQDINPLQMMWQSGIFDEESFLGKSMHNALTAEQLTRYYALVRERRAFNHRAQIELAVLVLEQSLPMSDAQRREFITLLSTTTKPPRKSGTLGYYVLMYQLSELPDEKLKPFFDHSQWPIVRRHLDQFKAWKQWLKQSGQLPEEDDADKADAEPAAGKK